VNHASPIWVKKKVEITWVQIRALRGNRIHRQ
jgi:hypothetical protein